MSTQKLVLKTLFVSMAAIMAAPTYAENKLPRIDVVGEGVEAVTKQPGAVSIVTKEDLELMQPMSTEDALREVPGLVIKPEEESAVVVNIGMRGLSAADSKTLILEDGVPVAPGLFVGNARYYNPRIQRMESIEVLKGAASLRYGPSTIGGVINYKTKTPEDGVSVSGRVGSHNYKETTIEAGGSAPSGEAFGGLVYTKAESDGFQDKDFKMNDLMVKGGMALGENQWVSAKFTHYDNDANISYRGLFLEEFENEASYNPAPDDYFLTERDSFDINHELEISPNVKLNTLVYWSQVYRDYWRYDVKEADSATANSWVYEDTLAGNNRSFERQGIDSRLNIQHQLLGLNNQTELGVRFDTEMMKDTKILATRAQPRSGTLSKDVEQSATSMAFYGQNRFEINDKLAVTPGLRIESYVQRTDDLQDNTNDGKTTNTELMPGVGATFQATSMAQVFGGVYKAFAPAQNADAIDGGTDQKLEAERSTNIEIGVRGANQDLSYELAAFRMDFQNQVIPSNSGGFVNANGGKTLHQGIEGAVGFDLGAGLSFDANATYVPDAKFVDGDNDGNRVTYAPELVAHIKLGFQTGGLQTALSANYISEQYTDATNTEALQENTSGFFKGKLDSYTTVDLNAHYAVNKQLSVFGAVKNLTDERYIAGLRQGIYAGPERSFELGAKYKF